MFKNTKDPVHINIAETFQRDPEAPLFKAIITQHTDFKYTVRLSLAFLKITCSFTETPRYIYFQNASQFQTVLTVN